MLCDLTAQPEEIRATINQTIKNVKAKQISQVGLRLMKFCATWDLQRVSENAQLYAEPLQARYVQ